MTEKKYLDNGGLATLVNNIKSKVEAIIEQLNNKKQDKLISGTNIKTINGNSILGEGNIDIEGDGVVNWEDIQGKPLIRVDDAGLPLINTIKFIDNIGFYDTYGNRLNICMDNSKNNILRVNGEPIFAIKDDLNDKQDVLVSGTNIKTINGNSILGEGNIDIEGGAQVQSDWNETDATSPAYIKNCPNLTRQYLNIHGRSGGFLTPKDMGVDEDLHGISMNGLEGVLISASGLTFLPEFNDGPVWEIHNTGNGTKFLSNDGTYKEVYTKSEIDNKLDNKLGDINTILESIINS